MTRVAAALVLAAFAAVGLTTAPDARAGAATSTALTPYGVATDSFGNVYVADAFQAVVLKVDPSGSTVTVVAGIPGSPGAPAPGPATDSQLSVPSALAIDDADNLYIADAGSNQVVEKVTPSGSLTIVAGVPGALTKPFLPGPATASGLAGPSGLAVDGNGDLYVSALWHAVVGKVDALTGDLSIVAGTPGVFSVPTFGPAAQSSLYLPMGVAAPDGGGIYIADSGNHLVERVGPLGDLSVVAGVPGAAGPPTPGPAAESKLSGPTGLALDAAGNLYIADPLNRMVMKVDSASGELSVVAGTGASGAPTPGPATDSRLEGPTDLAVDPAGNLFIADGGNSLVLKVTPSGTLSVFAGTGAGLALTPPEPPDATCDTTKLTKTYGDVRVPAGAICTLEGAKVLGDVVADDAESVTITGTDIGQNLTITSSDAVSVTDSKIGNDATVEDNTGPLVFMNNRIGGSLRFNRNSGYQDAALVVANTVADTVTCNGNDGLALACNAPEGGIPADPCTDPAARVGTPGPDVIRGTAGADIICGLGGNDVLRGLGGDDVIIGGEGRDLMRGDAGADVIEAGPGDDTVDGGDGDDTLGGGAGNDLVLGGSGADAADGGDGDDTIRGNDGDDRLTGGAGLDRLLANAGRDKLFAADGVTPETVNCGEDADTVDADHGDRLRACSP